MRRQSQGNRVMYPLRLRLLASRQAVAWFARWRRLSAQLRAAPANPDAWLWRLQSRILRYLLNRYGDDPTIGESPQHVIDEFAYFHEPMSPGRPPRSRESIRAILERIAAAHRLPAA